MIWHYLVEPESLHFTHWILSWNDAIKNVGVSHLVPAGQRIKKATALYQRHYPILLDITSKQELEVSGSNDLADNRHVYRPAICGYATDLVGMGLRRR